MSQTGKLAGRVALITGAGGEIGAAIAKRLAAEGASIVAADLRGESAERTATDIRNAGGAAVAQETDVSNPDHAARAAAKASEAFGGLNILVNVAAAVTPD